MNKPIRHPLSDAQRDYIAARRNAIALAEAELRGALSMVLAEARLTGNWALAADGAALECADPQPEPQPAQ